jgi:hypothetical protein
VEKARTEAIWNCLDMTTPMSDLLIIPEAANALRVSRARSGTVENALPGGDFDPALVLMAELLRIAIEEEELREKAAA